MFIRSDLHPPIGKQRSLLNAHSIKEQLISQLLLYDQVVIPTNDFSVVPVLCQWFGANNLLHLLSQNALSFVRPSRLFGFTGNHKGLCTYRIDRGDGPSNKKWEWWMEAIHSTDSVSAARAQIVNNLANTEAAITDRVIDGVCKSTIPYDFKDSPGSKSLLEDSYTDIRQCPLLHDELRKLCGYPKQLPDPCNVGLNLTSLRVLSTQRFCDPIDLLLWTADLNLRIRMASLASGADLESSPNTAVVLKDKVSRSHAAESRMSGFGRLLDLNRIPNVPKLVAEGSIAFESLVDFRDGKSARQFRSWLARAEPTDARDLERLYIDSLSNLPAVSSMPSRIFRFGITTILGAFAPISAIALSVVDSFFVERWLSGFQPKMFFDSMRVRF